VVVGSQAKGLFHRTIAINIGGGGKTMKRSRKKRVKEEELSYGFDPQKQKFDEQLKSIRPIEEPVMNYAVRPKGWTMGSTLGGWSKFVEDRRILSLPENIDDLIGMEIDDDCD